MILCFPCKDWLHALLGRKEGRCIDGRSGEEDGRRADGVCWVCSSVKAARRRGARARRRALIGWCRLRGPVGLSKLPAPAAADAFLAEGGRCPPPLVPPPNTPSTSVLPLQELKSIMGKQAILKQNDSDVVIVSAVRTPITRVRSP